MTRATIIASVFLAACLIFGGSGQGVLSNLLLQIGAVCIITWLLWHGSFAVTPSTTIPLRWIVLAGLAWSLIQLVPLPPGIWSALPGRSLIAQGFAVAGQPLPWLPLSLTPDATLSSLVSLLPAVAMGLVVVRREDCRVDVLIATLLLVTAAAIILGIVQLGGGEAYYLYSVSNFGAAAGFFANSNHMAALLLVAIPFLTALVARFFAAKRSQSERVAGLALTVIMIAVLLVGIVSNGSFAILLLGAPVVAASALLLIPPGRVKVGRMVILTGALALLGVTFLVAMAATGMSVGNISSVTIRKEIWEHSFALIGQFGLTGTGLGSFAEVYPLSENPGTVDWTYINHAHNDYIQLVLELGVPGAIVVAAFVFWWVKRTVELWRVREPARFARAGTIASGALLLHSIVDYPLRNAALSSVFAMAIAMMVIGGRTWRAGPAKGNSARHLTMEDLK